MLQGESQGPPEGGSVGRVGGNEPRISQPVSTREPPSDLEIKVPVKRVISLPLPTHTVNF